MSKAIRTGQITALITAHAKELMREPAVLFWGIIFPILMALGLGIAFTKSSETTNRIAVIHSGISTDSTKPIETFLNKYASKIQDDNELPGYRLVLKNNKLGNSIFIFQRMDWKQAETLLKKGEISLILEEKNNKIQFHFDPAAPDAQLNYMKLSRVLSTDKPVIQNSENVAPLTLKGTRYIDFLIPGLIALGILMSSIWGLGYSLIEKRSKKLLRRMVATPMKKSYFLISFISVRTFMNLIEACLLFLFSYIVFGITIQGSLLALLLIFIAGNINFAGLSAFISSRTANPEVGNGIISAVTTPMFVLSGIFFSYHHFPDWSIPFIKILPLTMLADSVRSIFIEGAGYQEVAVPFFVLLGMGLIFFFIGLKTFKWY
jgi:ABC-type multidrug transport system permease subunit